MTELDDIEKRSILKDEYLHIQSAIEAFDGQLISIKIWSLVLNLAAITVAFVFGTPEVFLVASFGAAMFWVTEGHWTQFQHAYYDRAGKLEAFFTGEQKDIQPLQIGASWYEHWQKSGIKRLLRIMSWPHVCMPHIAIIVLGAFLYLLAVTGCITV